MDSELYCVAGSGRGVCAPRFRAEAQGFELITEQQLGGCVHCIEYLRARISLPRHY